MLNPKQPSPKPHQWTSRWILKDGGKNGKWLQSTDPGSQCFWPLFRKVKLGQRGSNHCKMQKNFNLQIFPYHHAFLLWFDQILHLFGGLPGLPVPGSQLRPRSEELNEGVGNRKWRRWKQGFWELRHGSLPFLSGQEIVSTKVLLDKCWYFLVKFKPMLTNYADNKMFISPSWALLWNDARHVSQEFVMSDISIISVVITQPSETSPLYLFNNAGKVKPKWHGCTRQKDYKHKKKTNSFQKLSFCQIWLPVWLIGISIFCGCV